MPVIIGGERDALALSKALEDEGFLVGGERVTAGYKKAPYRAATPDTGLPEDSMEFGREGRDGFRFKPQWVGALLDLLKDRKSTRLNSSHT